MSQNPYTESDSLDPQRADSSAAESELSGSHGSGSHSSESLPSDSHGSESLIPEPTTTELRDDSTEIGALARTGDSVQEGSAGTSGEEAFGGYGEIEQSLPQPGHSEFGQAPEGQPAYGQPGQDGQNPYGQPAYGQAGQDGQNPYGQPAYGQAGYAQQGQHAQQGQYAHAGQAPYAQAPYAQPPMGQAPMGYAPAYVEPKSRVAAGLLGLFLGTLGVHNFYLGYTGKGVAQLLITLLLGWTGFGLIATGVWSLVESILIFTKSGGYLADARGVVLRD